MEAGEERILWSIPARRSTAVLNVPDDAFWRAHIGTHTHDDDVSTHTAHTTQVVPLLKPVSQCWQPSELLPASNEPDFIDQVGRWGMLPVMKGEAGSPPAD